MKKQNNIEEIFQEAFNKFEADPGANSWANIQSSIGAESAASASGTAAASSAAASSSVATTIAAIAIGAIAIGGYFYFNDTAEKIKTKEQKTTVDQPKIIDEESKNLTVDTKDLSEEIENNSISNSNSSSKNNFSTKSNDYSEPSTEHSVTKDKPDNAESKDAEKDMIIGESTTKENTNQGTETDPENNSKTTHSSTQNAQAENVPQSNNHSTEEKDKLDEQSVPSDPSSKPLTGSSSENSESKPIMEPDFDIPNVFTPNQDGVNDQFEIEIDQFDRIEIKIFSQSNRLIFETNRLTNYWDGTMPDGSPASEGYYFYQIIVEKEGKTFKKADGVSLKR